MRTGVLAMFDALGFRGIWNRPETKVNPERVIEKLRELEREANTKLSREFGGVENAVRSDENILGSAAFSFLSDTIVFGLTAKAPTDRAHAVGWTMVVAADFVSNVVREAAMSSPALAYRGCVAFGSFALERNFIVGPAVDEAAENMDRAQGAFVWSTPSAHAALVEAGFATEASDTSLAQYAVPMKGGDVFQTEVVNPLDRKGSRAQSDALTDRILQTFSGGLDVMIKRQNTELFLRQMADRRWPSQTE